MHAPRGQVSYAGRIFNLSFIVLAFLLVFYKNCGPSRRRRSHTHSDNFREIVVPVFVQIWGLVYEVKTYFCAKLCCKPTSGTC